MKGLKVILVAAAVATSAVSAFAGLPITNAYDDADSAAYGALPNHNWKATNGGFGYNLWTPLAGIAGGGTFMEGPGVNNRGVPNTNEFSFALFAGGAANSGYAISRPLVTSIVSGEFDVFSRFDLAGNGPNLFNLRAGNNTNSFGLGELLSFGIVNSNVLSYTDSTGFHTINTGEARGAVWSWNVDFDGAAGTYSMTVTNLGNPTAGVSGGFSFTVNGNLEASATSVGSFAVINSSSGNNQNLIFSDPTFTTIPEPSTIALVGISLLGAWIIRRRKA